jgi:hypothetical protein
MTISSPGGTVSAQAFANIAFIKCRLAKLARTHRKAGFRTGSISSRQAVYPVEQIVSQCCGPKYNKEQKISLLLQLTFALTKLGSIQKMNLGTKR